MKKKLLVLGVLFLVAIPFIASATGLVPCGTSSTPKCTLCHLFVLGRNIVDFLTLTIAPSLAVLAFAWAGFKILISGGSPGQRQEGMKIIRNTVIGLLIVFGAWIIINELLLFFAGGTGTTAKISGLKMPWDKIECIAPLVTVPVVAPTKFNNRSSDELSALVACVKASVPTVRVTSWTDDNINGGTCDPTDPSETFNSSTNCQHEKNSCHYGGTNCISRGSFAFDFGTKSYDPLYATVAAAVLTCNGAAYVQPESDHGHASIGATNGCGCN